MPTTPIQGLLLDTGHVIEESYGGYKTATSTYLVCTWRSGTLHNIPALGDTYPSDVHLQCIDIAQSYYVDENKNAGTKYICKYDNFTVNAGSDILGGAKYGTVQVSIQGGASFDVFTKEKSKGGSWYISPDATSGTFVALNVDVTVPVQNCTIGVNVTDRYRGSMTTLIDQLKTVVGKLNNATLWGLPKGSVLLASGNATPVVESVTNAYDTESWNRTYSYQIKTLLDSGSAVKEDSWQYVFIDGCYQRISKIEHPTTASDYINPYQYATLPNAL